MTNAIGVGIIGLGFMGRAHLRAYERAAAAGFGNRLVAVCDSVPARRAGHAAEGGNLARGAADERLFDATQVAGYERVEDLLADERVHLVSICTPTETHVDLALAALQAGKHVLVEKPLALAASESARLAAGARAAPTLCLPAMCLRFWPAWSWLRERVRDGALGAVRSAVFQRLGSRPRWASFYGDPRQSGGALFDLHIHDADFVRWCFGPPQALAATGDLDHVTALYRYARGPVHVVAEGGWDHAPGFPFRMRYVAVFERGTADYEFGRDPELLLAQDGARAPVALPDLDGYDGEVRHLLGRIAAGRRELAATVDEAVALLEMLEEERRLLA
ncbi:MAG: Gfo/Idh/MocA family oxidoreductase [Planctomycetes bacterium]|nr:Gfo/Idh/MocA family oxidoreductase [Planctomycetota bacterium]